MSPAPGPSSPLADAGPASSPLSATIPTPPAVDVATPSSEGRQDRAYPTAGPKTCVYCGRHIESSDAAMLVDESSVNAAPSPSSVAFATNASSSSRLSSLLGSNTAVQTPEGSATDESSHQVCSSCATNPSAAAAASTAVASSSRGQPLTTRTTSRERTRRASTARARHVSDGGEDVIMTNPDAPSDSISDINTRSQERSIAHSTSPNRNRTASVHPWRRAPWARTEHDSILSSIDQASSNTVPLSISLSNIGAGGDAHMSLAGNEDEFPPLPRSPPTTFAAGQSATSPRLPVSPTRTRTAASPPTSPTGQARRTSFTRSQSASSISPAGPMPIVNFPSRGRNRAGSTSSTSGVQASSSTHHTRRTSTHRKLSRSDSSHGMSGTAILESAGMVMEGSAIEEDPYGPNAMTRPRLSTLKAQEMVSSAASSSILVSSLEKPSGPQEESNEEDKRQELTWFRYNRPDPRRDINKLRCLSRGRGCLFPGAVFNGTQKSGRMSYDVTVQIVNVDITSSHLCGYLNIRGLTDDWPELTTYFDAEIIGQRYGFVTGKWGATEADDMKHWSRFSPFRPLKNSLVKPELRFNHLNKPFIFMRWKERFLVPDHRVRDINGASFAGFYYVCVELGEQDGTQGPTSPTPALPTTIVTSPGGPNVPAAFTRQRSGSNRRRLTSSGGVPTVGGPAATSTTWSEAAGVVPTLAAENPNDTPEGEGGVRPNPSFSASLPTMGRMSGFYFHEHSEPYQQLTLQHVAERSSSSFELR